MRNEKNISKSDGIYLLVLFLFSILVNFLHLGSMALWDTDEALYTQISREMQISGDYLTTQWNGQPWFCHPPLYFWMTAISAKVFGWTAFAARFPSAFFGVLLVLLIYFMGKLLFSPKAGFYAGLVTASTFQLWLQSRMAILDMPFLFFIVAAVYLFFLAENSQKPDWHILGFWTFCGLAVIAKGPVGLLLPLLYVGFEVFAGKRWQSARRIVTSPGILLFLLITVPWYLAMTAVYGEPFTSMVFDYFFITRIIKPVMNQSGAWYYYIPFFLAGFLPWTAFLPLTFYGLYKNRADHRAKFLLAWVVVTFLIFTMAGTKRPNYILFLYPALSLALGWVLDGILNGENHARAFKYSFVAFSLSAVIVISVFGFAAVKLYPDYWAQYSGNLTPLGVALIIGGLMTLVLTFKKKDLAFYSVIAMTGVTYLMLISYTPLVESLRPEPRMAAEIKKVFLPGDHLIMRGNFGRQFSIVFYTGIPADFYHSDESFIKAINRGRESYGVIQKKNFETLSPEIRVPVSIIQNDDGLVLFRSGSRNSQLQAPPLHENPPSQMKIP